MNKEQEIERMKLNENSSSKDFEQKNKELQGQLKQAANKIRSLEDEIKDLLLNNNSGNAEMKKTVALLNQRIELN